MNKLLLLTAMFYFIQQELPFAQSCSMSQAYETIQNSAMKVGLLNGGDMFWDGTSRASFSIPYVYGQPETHTTFAESVWMGGRDSGGNLHIAAQMYRQGHDYFAGPLDQNTGEPVTDGCTNFDYIWKVKRWAIQQHIDDFNDNGVIDGPVDLTILRWPGKNNPQFAAQMGFQLPNQDLAPFYDRNGNTIYEPMLGDYPVFKHGEPTAVAAEILWSVFNDNGNVHGLTNGTPLKVEVQQTAYLFDCTNDPLLTHTLFVKHKVINRNSLPYTDFYYGHWADFDLGCYADDYIGTLPNKNTIYVYNSDQNDDPICGSVVQGYGTNPPVRANTFLNQSLTHSIYHTNSNSNGLGMPQSASQFYNLLQGKFIDGAPITMTGTGYNLLNPTNAPTSDYIFPTKPNNPTGWSMVSSALPGLDQMTLGSIHKSTFAPGEVWEIDLAHSYHRDMANTSYENVDLMDQQIDLIQQFYDNNFNAVSCVQASYCTANCVYPGDANNNGIANDFDILEMGRYYGASAVTRSVVGNNWLPHDPPTPSTNAYVDADGTNMVDSLDLEANTINFDETHALYTGAAEGVNTVGTDLTFSRYYTTFSSFFANLDTIVHLNRYAAVDVNLGDALQNIADVHGVTFRVVYDESTLELAETPYSPVPLVGFSRLTEGWLGDDGAAVYAREIREPGEVNFVATRLNQVNYTGGGDMGRLIFKVKTTAPVTATTMSTDICFRDFKAVRADGSAINIGAECITIQYQDTNFVTSVQNIPSTEALIQVYPNPAKKHINMDLLGQHAKSVILYDVLGIAVYQEKNINGILQIAKKDLPTGIYNLVVELDNGQTTTHKVIFQ